MNNPPDREVEVFNAALQLPVAQRAGYLESECAGDDVLRRRIEALLQMHNEIGGFLENPTQELARSVAEPAGPSGTIRVSTPTIEKTGERIGPYKLLQQIGEGGCGVVYMAEQMQPVRRKVALKVIKLGMDTKNVIARFEAERQALALMDHPNIAKVLDAGATETGRPFFVMELVKGVRITDYCDQNNLATQERLKLFTQVCHAIQHAHQKGIIHRDIKPSNILVTLHDGVPVPKVIDFGIAKATTDQPLTDKTLFTAFEQFIGTPAYMSPEQAEMTGLDIDTRTDIYALGVLLYELLTGRTPFDPKALLASGLEAMRRTIREEEPQRPSTRLSTMVAADLTAIARHRGSDAPKLVHVVRGDLDWIVMKCLEKDRSRRYETANGVAMDIQRHLSNEPVIARPPSHLYEFQKTVRRHKFGFSAAAAVFAALVLGLVGTSFGFVRSQRQRHLAQAAEHEAQKNFATAQAAVDNLLEVVDRDLHDVSGMEPLRVKLWREAIDRYKPFLERPSADPTPRAELARLYVKYAFAAEYIGADHEKIAVPAYRSALAIQEQLVREHPQDRRLRSNLAWTHLLSVWAAPFGPARSQSLAQAVVMFEALAGETPGDALARADLAWALYNSSWGSGAQQRALSERVLAIREQLLSEFPKSAEFRRDLANSLRHQASLLDSNEATLAMLHRSIDLDTALAKDIKQGAEVIWLPARPSDSELFGSTWRWTKRDEAAGCIAAARVHGRIGKWTESLALADRAVGIYRRLVEQDSTVTDFITELWDADTLCAQAAEQTKDAAQTETRRVAAADFWRELARDSAQQQLKRSGYFLSLGQGHSQWEIAEMLRKKGQRQQAEQVLRDALDVFEKAAQTYPDEPYLRQEQACSHRLLGGALEELGRSDEAVREHRAALALYAGLKVAAPTNSFYHEEEAYTTWMLAAILERMGRLDAAEAEYRQAIVLHDEGHAEFPNQAVFTDRLLTIKARLLEMLFRRGRLAEAGIMARETARKCHTALAQYEKLASAPDRHNECWSFANSYEAIGGVLKDIGQAREAENVYRDTQVLWQKLVADFNTEDHRFHLAANYDALGNLLRQAGQAGESLEAFRAAQTIWLESVAELNVEDRWMHLGWTDDDIGRLLKEAGRFDEAAEAFRAALGVWKKLVTEFKKDDYRNRLSGTLFSLATVLQTAGKRTEAEAMFREAAEHADAQTLNELAWPLATDSNPKLRDGPRAVAFAEKAVAGTDRTNAMIMDTLAAAYAEAGQFTNAVRVQQEAIALLLTEPEKKDYASRLKLYENKSPYRDVGSLAGLISDRLREGKFAEAEVSARECLAIREKEIPDDWRTFNSRSVLGGCLLGQKKYTEAEPLLLSGCEGMTQREDKIPAVGKPRLMEAQRRLVDLYEATARPELAAEWKQKLARLDPPESAVKAAVSRP